MIFDMLYQQAIRVCTTPQGETSKRVLNCQLGAFIQAPQGTTSNYYNFKLLKAIESYSSLIAMERAGILGITSAPPVAAYISGAAGHREAT
jgi:hypothetical protein